MSTDLAKVRGRRIFEIGSSACRDITDSNGDELCDNGVKLAFTNYSWPIGVKRDRGLNITFTKDIILQPGGWLGAPQSGNGANVALSFKDDKNKFRCVTVQCWPQLASDVKGWLSKKDTLLQWTLGFHDECSQGFLF